MFSKYQALINYSIFGIFTTIVSLGTYYALVGTVLNPRSGIQLQIANTTSWIVSATFAYITNRTFVFKSHRKDWINEIIAFFASRIATLLIDIILMFIMVTLLSYNDKLIKFVIQVIIIIGNFVLSKVFVFKQKYDYL